jgi:hypothetical protein
MQFNTERVGRVVRRRDELVKWILTLIGFLWLSVAFAE